MMEAFDLYSPEIDADPFPYYEILRERYPCYWSEGGKLWILSRYDDIVQAARDWERFSSSQGNMIDELPPRGATLGTTDPPCHDLPRALSQPPSRARTSSTSPRRPSRLPTARSIASASARNSSSSTIFPARSRSATPFRPWPA
jgi:cytochrome P450